MKKADYSQWETGQNGMQVILEFPERSEEEESITSEVRQILVSLLHDHCTLPEHFGEGGEKIENE